MTLRSGYTREGDVWVDDDGWSVCERCRDDFDEDGGTDELGSRLLCWECVDNLAEQGDPAALALVAGGAA